MERFYKLARPDGYDFYTGKTINYAAAVGGVVRPPNPDPTKKLCSSGLIHASDEPNKCFVGAKIPCRAFLVEGDPVLCDEDKCGFVELRVLEEIQDLDALFGWNYTEACNPVNPFLLPQASADEKALALLKDWDSVGDSVGVAVRYSVWASVGVAVRYSVGDSVGAAVRASVWASVGSSVWASVFSYIGSLFPAIKEWKYVAHQPGVYPFQSGADLWRMGIVPSYGGKKWRLHSGAYADIIWEGVLQ